MITALDADPALFDPSEQTFVSNIREHGWTGTSVYPDDVGPRFSYTTGFWLSTGQPEIIIFGMKNEIAHQVSWDVFRNAQAGKTLPVGRLTDEVFGNLPAYVFPVSERHYPDHLGWSMWFYGGANPFPCLQIVWPDRAGNFPWNSGFDANFAGLQIDLTENGWQSSIVN